MLFCIAMIRGQATYWLARVVTEQALRHTRPARGWRARVHRWLASDAMERGRGTVQRFGTPAVPLCYLTVGLQTVVLASAGVLRMRWLRFSVVQSVGALAWAVIYSTIGFAVWAAFFEAALVGGVGTALGIAAVAAIIAVAVHRRFLVRRRTRIAGSRSTAGRDESVGSPAARP